MISNSRITIILALLLSFSASSQELRPYQLRKDTVEVIPDEYIYQVKDTLQGFMQKPGELLPFNRKEFRQKKNHSYWFTFRIANATGTRMELGMDAWSDIADYVVLRSSGRSDTCTTGIYTPWSSKKEFKRTNVCSFSLDSAETVTVLYRAKFVTRIFENKFKVAIYPPALRARKDLASAEEVFMRDEGTIYNFYAGLFAMASLVYFFFFYIVREKLFLYFGLFVFLLAFSASRLVHLYSFEHPEANPYIQLVNPLSFFSFILFYREYFNSQKTTPILDRILVVLALINIALSVHFAVTGNLFFDAQSIVVSVAMIVVMSIIPFRIRSKDKEHKYFLLYAALPLLVLIPLIAIAILINTLSGGELKRESLLGEFFNNVNYIQLWALTWMVLFFSRTLIKRFTLQREQILKHETEKQAILLQQEQEKTLLMEKLNADLETKVQLRTAELKTSLENLRTTQSQLIQSEKMASLGEMTAGIAHEIQNPLNFVNNFAELNKELAEEIRDAIRNKAGDEEINALIGDMADNADKIQTHGKRAESIVRNMLQHSRTGEGVKEETDLNQLVEEFVKLSFHGFRARDKQFNADFRINTSPEPRVAKVVSQNIGRVILNLANNAFYAVHTRNKKGEPGFAPLVIASTQHLDGIIRITVEDNGDGIPEKIREKIFQPFFTTKPTGEGTGLGLSLSYDIITKGHQGKMQVESEEGKGTRFIIDIPA